MGSWPPRAAEPNWIFETGDDKAAEWTVRKVWDASLHIMGSRTFHDMAAGRRLRIDARANARLRQSTALQPGAEA